MSEAFLDKPLTKEETRKYFKQVKEINQEYKPKIEYLLQYHNELQIKALKENFTPSPIIINYKDYFNIPFPSIMNIISSMEIRSTVGRQKTFVVIDKNYRFLYGFLKFTSPTLAIGVVRDYLKEKLGTQDRDTINQHINNHLLNIAVCVGVGILTQYLTGKLLVYISISKEIKDIMDSSYSMDLKYLLTTSLYGKSSQYNRIKELEYLGLTKGYNSTFTKEQRKWVLETYKKLFPDRKITTTAKAPHLYRLYTSIYNKLDGKVPFKPVLLKKGVYFYDSEKYPWKSMEENVAFWCERWYYPRKQRIDSGEVKIERRYYGN